MNDVIYDAKGLSEGRNWCTGGPIWVHARADIGSCERAVMGLESRAVSVRVTVLSILLLYLVKHVRADPATAIFPRYRELSGSV